MYDDKGITQDDLLYKPKIYEDYAPLSPQLRRSAQAGVVIAGAALPIGIFCEAAMASAVYSGALRFLAAIVLLPLSIVASPIGIVLNVVALAVFIWLWYEIDTLQDVHLNWHKTATGIAALGAFDALALILPLAVGLLNGLFAILWPVLVVIFWTAVVIVIVFVLLG